MRTVVWGAGVIAVSVAGLAIAACSSASEEPSDEATADGSTSDDSGVAAALGTDGASSTRDASPSSSDAKAGDAKAADACTVVDGGVGAVCATGADCACGTICAAFRCVPAATCDEAVLSWDGPTTFADGTCLTTLAGFNVYWTRDAGANAGPDASGSNMVNAGLPCVPGAVVACGDAGQTVTQLACSYRIKPLVDGQWTFTVTDYDNVGTESPPSISASKTIACP